MEDLLSAFLQGHAAKGVYPFHMPGHKQNPTFFPQNMHGWDITEIPGADNLNHPTGTILRLQQRLAKLFGAEESLLSVNGSTGGNLAAIMSHCSGGAMIMSRNAHRSAFGALTLADVRPVYIQPEMTEHGFCGEVTPEAVAEALQANVALDMRAVFVTSPTYEGVVSDITAIAGIAHAHGLPLIVDEAHGAHMAFAEAFPRSALACGADVVIQSLHKTLPYMTQTAVVHMQGTLAKRMQMARMLSVIQTSSPSYVLMGQADYVTAELEQSKGALFDAYIERLTAFRDAVAGLRHVQLFDGEGVFDADKGKLVFILPEALSGEAFERQMYANHRVQLEMSGLHHAIAMTSPADTKEGFDRLLDGLRAIDAACDGRCAKGAVLSVVPNAPQLALNPREASLCETEEVPLAEARGRVAASFLIPYPPGIPLVAPGEVVTDEVIEKFCVCLDNGIPVIGQGDHNCVAVIGRSAVKGSGFNS